MAYLCMCFFQYTIFCRKLQEKPGNLAEYLKKPTNLQRKFIGFFKKFVSYRQRIASQSAEPLTDAVA